MIQKILDFLKMNYVTIFKILFGLFILYYLIFFLTPKMKMTESQKAQLDSLNVSVKKLEQTNTQLENKINNFDLQIKDVDFNIKNIKTQKTIIKEYYHEKIISVDNFTTGELDSFFTERYKY